MSLSIIIVTYQRLADLGECLDSVLNQSVLPNEVVIVDNAAGCEVEQLVSAVRPRFDVRSVAIRCIKNSGGNSLASGRNAGAKNVSGDIVLYLDDDVILDEKYIEEVLKVYRGFPSALGVQGYIVNSNPKYLWFKNLLGKVFFLGYLAEDDCRVFPSGGTTYPSPLNSVLNCQWLSGANHSYNRQVLLSSGYDQNLKKWSQCEDIDFSYRVYKKNPESLYITPHARLVHKVSPAGRMPKKELVQMCEIYELYFFYKNYAQSFGNWGVYLWSRIGKFFVNILRSFAYRSSNGLTENFYIVGALLTCFRNRELIRKGDLEFFNRNL